MSFFLSEIGKRGTGALCAQHPKGRSGKRAPVPLFPLAINKKSDFTVGSAGREGKAPPVGILVDIRRAWRDKGSLPPDLVVQPINAMTDQHDRTGPIQTPVQRRGVLRAMFGSLLGIGFTALGAAGGLWAAATARFFMPNVINEPAGRVRVGWPSDYPPGCVQARYKEKYGVWVVNSLYRGRQQIYALRTACTHLGCITLWQENEQKFKCPCHGSGFDRNGVNFEGPAPRPLERYAIRIADDGQLEIGRASCRERVYSGV